MGNMAVGPGVCPWEGPPRPLLGFSPHFDLMLLIPEGNRWGTRKEEIKFWAGRLIINLAEKLGFKGTQFHH